jgi:hypothetical protein
MEKRDDTKKRTPVFVNGEMGGGSKKNLKIQEQYEAAWIEDNLARMETKTSLKCSKCKVAFDEIFTFVRFPFVLERF